MRSLESRWTGTIKDPVSSVVTISPVCAKGVAIRGGTSCTERRWMSLTSTTGKTVRAVFGSCTVAMILQDSCWVRARDAGCSVETMTISALSSLPFAENSKVAWFAAAVLKCVVIWFKWWIQCFFRGCCVSESLDAFALIQTSEGTRGENILLKFAMAAFKIIWAFAWGLFVADGKEKKEPLTNQGKRNDLNRVLYDRDWSDLLLSGLTCTSINTEVWFIWIASSDWWMLAILSNIMNTGLRITGLSTVTYILFFGGIDIHCRNTFTAMKASVFALVAPLKCVVAINPSEARIALAVFAEKRLGILMKVEFFTRSIFWVVCKIGIPLFAGTIPIAVDCTRIIRPFDSRGKHRKQENNSFHRRIYEWIINTEFFVVGIKDFLRYLSKKKQVKWRCWWIKTDEDYGTNTFEVVVVLNLKLARESLCFVPVTSYICKIIVLRVLLTHTRCLNHGKIQDILSYLRSGRVSSLNFPEPSFRSQFIDQLMVTIP